MVEVHEKFRLKMGPLPPFMVPWAQEVEHLFETLYGQREQTIRHAAAQLMSDIQAAVERFQNELNRPDATTLVLRAISEIVERSATKPPVATDDPAA